MYTLKLILVQKFSSLGWFSFSSTFSWTKIFLILYVHTKIDTCAKFQLSRFILIFIKCYQVLLVFGSCWQLIKVDITKNDWNFFKVYTKVDTFANYQLSWFILIFTNCYQLLKVVKNCWQLMTVNDSCKQPFMGKFGFSSSKKSCQLG